MSYIQQSLLEDQLLSLYQKFIQASQFIGLPDDNFCGCEARNLASLNLAENGGTVADLVSHYSWG